MLGRERVGASLDELRQPRSARNQLASLGCIAPARLDWGRRLPGIHDRVPGGATL